jgi:hypothetical protein
VIVFRRPSPALVVACLALIVALAGTAVAAEQYVITSTNQIKPSVLKELRGLRATAHAASIETPSSIIAHSYSLGAVATGEPDVAVADPLAPVTWTQRSYELNGFAGVVVGTIGPGCEASASASVYVSVPGWTGRSWGSSHSEVVLFGNIANPAPEVAHPGELVKDDLVGADGTAWTLYTPGTPTTRTLTATVENHGRPGCHFTIDHISIDVIGAKP